MSYGKIRPMKAVAKGFAIAAIVLAALGLIGEIVYLIAVGPMLSYYGFTVYFVAAIIGSLVCIAASAYAIASLENATSARQLLAPAIIALLFSNIVTGIVMLCMKDQDVKPYAFGKDLPRKKSLEDELSAFMKMREDGIITEAEYEEGRKKIIERHLDQGQ